MTRAPLYLIECDYARLGRAYIETTPGDPDTSTFSGVRKYIADGQAGDVRSVHLIDFAAGTVADVTTQFLDVIGGD